MRNCIRFTFHWVSSAKYILNACFSFLISFQIYKNQNMVLPGMGSGTGRSFSGLWSNSFRVKSPRYPTGEEGDSRYSTIWELTNAGLASGLVLGVAAISGQVAAFVAGPAAIFSIIIAATAAVLTGQSIRAPSVWNAVGTFIEKLQRYMFRQALYLIVLQISPIKLQISPMPYV